MLSLILMLSPNFNFLGLTIFSSKQINPHLPKFANKNKGTTRSREIPMRMKIGKKLKTASLNSRFTGSRKEEFFDLFIFEKF